MFLKIKTHLKAKLLTGLFTILPVIVTFWILYHAFRFTEALLAPYLRDLVGRQYIPGLGILVIILLIYGVGVFTSNIVGRKIVSLGENILTRLPMAKQIFSSSKEVIQTISSTYVSSPYEQRALHKVVFVPYPHPEALAVGFVTGRPIQQVQELLPEPMSYVFVPHSPTPMTGILMLVPDKAIISVPYLTVEEGIKLIVSCGFVAGAKSHQPFPPEKLGFMPGQSPQPVQ